MSMMRTWRGFTTTNNMVCSAWSRIAESSMIVDILPIEALSVCKNL